MPSSLSETLAAIGSERGGRFGRGFELVDRLLAEFGEQDLAERLNAAIPIGCPWQVVADLFGILSRSAMDDGATLGRVMGDRLQAGEDKRRIRVALHLESCPILDRSEMEQVLRGVAAKHPDVAAWCDELIKSRPRLPG